MKQPIFTFDDEANGWLSEPFAVKGKASVEIELESRAPLLTMKEEESGEYAIYGQSPKESDNYKFTITSNEEVVLKLATPVEVIRCIIFD